MLDFVAIAMMSEIVSEVGVANTFSTDVPACVSVAPM